MRAWSRAAGRARASTNPSGNRHSWSPRPRARWWPRWPNRSALRKRCGRSRSRSYGPESTFSIWDRTWWGGAGCESPGPRARKVALRHAETLGPDGGLYVANLRSARATDTYILSGGGTEVWEPRFTYHGFRYVEVTGYPGEPTPASLEGRVVHDDMARAGEFTSSNELLNQIHHNIFWGVRGNYRSIPTDCPQRDERMGWLGDRSMVSRSESYLFDVAAFYTKWEQDIADSQRPSGSIPDVSPNYWTMYNDDVTWPSTFLFVPGMLYDQYGDRRVVERFYPAMKKWIEHMRGFLKDDLMPRDTYGDWCVPPESPSLIHSKDPARRTDGTLIGTAYYYKLLMEMSRYARVIGEPGDARDFEALAGRVKTAFQKKFFDSADGVYSNGTQTSGILPLAFDITPDENRAGVFADLIRKIEQESKGHVGTGLVGAQWLMRTLSDNGRAGVAYEIADTEDLPRMGLHDRQRRHHHLGTVERRHRRSGDELRQPRDADRRSRSLALRVPGGYTAGSGKTGFKHIVIRPYPVGDLTFVNAWHQSPYGRIASGWKREGSRFQLNVTIPPNTTATVWVPGKEGAVEHKVGSGTYAFASELP